MKSMIFILRIIVVFFAGLFSAYFSASIATGLVNIGSIAGLCLSLWLLCVAIKPLHNWIKEMCMKTMFTKVMFWLVNIGFITFAVYGIIVSGAMIYFACQKPADNSTAIVLGAQVKSWGPSEMLRGRINAAEEYLIQNPDCKAVLTGGKGDDEPMSEADSMYEAMCDDGISSERLIKENKATNTYENIMYSQEILAENNIDGDITIITDGFHQFRAKIIANQLGIKGKIGAVNAKTSLRYLPTFAVREWFGLPYQILFQSK